MVRLIVEGQVQGVGFRAWTHHQAELRGLDGWVRNRRDGSVEAVLAGPDLAVQAMIETCRRGPASAAVDDVRAREIGEHELEWPVEPGRFHVRPTA